MAVSMSPRIGDRYNSPLPSFGTLNTAYTGADGHIDVTNLLDEDDDSFDHNAQLSPTRTTRSTLSTRLLSSLPGAQPAAAAALTRSKTILHSRAKSLAAWTSSFNTTSPDKAATGTNKLFGDLFSGESAPVRLGVSSASKEPEDSEFVMEYRPSLTQRPSLASRSKSNITTASQTPKQSWFSRKSTSPVTPATTNDELINLNINNALFPNGPADPLSPADFNDLLLNATRLLEQMQSAYREKVEYIASIQPEIEAQREEAEEAETRAQHLKLQLEDMGRKAEEHEQAITRLSTQLIQETSKAQQSVRVVNEHEAQRRHKRSSAGSASDSGFESDLDRDTDSVISSGIPTPRTPPAICAGTPFDNLDQRLNDRRLKLQRQAPLRAINLGHSMRNVDDSWIAIQQLSNENQDLRQQLATMQSTLQGCIDLVDSVHI